MAGIYLTQHIRLRRSRRRHHGPHRAQHDLDRDRRHQHARTHRGQRGVIHAGERELNRWRSPAMPTGAHRQYPPALNGNIQWRPTAITGGAQGVKCSRDAAGAPRRRAGTVRAAEVPRLGVGLRLDAFAPQPPGVEVVGRNADDLGVTCLSRLVGLLRRQGAPEVGVPCSPPFSRRGARCISLVSPSNVEDGASCDGRP